MWWSCEGVFAFGFGKSQPSTSTCRDIQENNSDFRVEYYLLSLLLTSLSGLVAPTGALVNRRVACALLSGSRSCCSHTVRPCSLGRTALNKLKAYLPVLVSASQEGAEPCSCFLFQVLPIWLRTNAVRSFARTPLP